MIIRRYMIWASSEALHSLVIGGKLSNLMVGSMQILTCLQISNVQ